MHHFYHEVRFCKPANDRSDVTIVKIKYQIPLRTRSHALHALVIRSTADKILLMPTCNMNEIVIWAILLHFLQRTHWCCLFKPLLPAPFKGMWHPFSAGFRLEVSNSPQYSITSLIAKTMQETLFGTGNLKYRTISACRSQISQRLSQLLA